MYVYIVTRIKPLDVKPDGPGSYPFLHTADQLDFCWPGSCEIHLISLLTLQRPSHGAHTHTQAQSHISSSKC